MVNVFTINKSDLFQNLRFEPSYYYYSKILKNKNIQKGFNFIKLDELSEIISDGEHSHIPRQKERAVRYLYGRNVKEGVINFDPVSDISYISEKNFIRFKRTHIKQNDILLTIVGTIGKSALYKSEYVGKAGIPRHIGKITLKQNSEITPEFITAFFRSKVGKWQLENITTGNIQPLLSIKNIRTLDIPRTPQNFIDNITALEKIAIKNEIKALSIISKAQELFYNKFNIDFSACNEKNNFSVNLSDFEKADLWTPAYSYPLYRNVLKAIQKKWQTVLLGEVATAKKGDEVGSNNYNKYLDKKDSDVQFIRTSDLVNYEIDQFPDFYIPEEIYQELGQDVKDEDVLFTKDGKIGMSAMITKNDKAIIASGIARLRLKTEANKYNLTPEYLFIVLSLKETGLFPAIRRTVVASTIPHLREERLKEFEIPVLDKNSINEITELVKEAFKLKDEKKKLIKEVSRRIDNYLG